MILVNMAISSKLIHPFNDVAGDFGPFDFAGQLLNLAFEERNDILFYTKQYNDILQYDLNNMKNNRKTHFETKSKLRHRVRRSKRRKRTGNRAQATKSSLASVSF